MAEKVQFIGYGINTGPKSTSDGKIYLGLDNETDDYKARVELIKQAAEKAAADSATDPNALKIFTVPEFYFRGKNGAYQLSTIMGEGENNRGLIGALQDTFMDVKWKKWLFVIGSIIGYSASHKEKEIEIKDILIPAYKPAEITENGKKRKAKDSDKVKKPVNADNLTVEETVRLTVYTNEFKEEFRQDKKIKTKSDTDALAVDAAKKWLLKQSDTIADPDVKKFAQKWGVKVDKDLAKIDSKKLGQLLENNPFTWEGAADTGKAKEAYNVVSVIEGGFATAKKAAENTRVVMKQYKSPIDFIKTTDVDSTSGYYPLVMKEVVTDISKGNDGVVDHLDDWGLVKKNGSVDTARVNKLKTQKDYGQMESIYGDNFVLLQYNAQAQNLDPLGIFKIGNLTFAIDVCLDHAKQVSKKMINALNHNDMKPVLEKVLSKESATVIKAAKDGVDVHIVPSCGMSIEAEAVVAKKNGYVFNCDGLNGERYDSNINGINLDSSDNFLEKAGYKSAGGAKSIGNAHTALMKVGTLDMDLANSSTLVPWDTKTKTKAIDLGLTQVTVNTTTTPIKDLYWEGSSKQYDNVPTLKNSTSGTINGVTVNGPVGGVIHIYEVVNI